MNEQAQRLIVITLVLLCVVLVFANVWLDEYKAKLKYINDECIVLEKANAIKQLQQYLKDKGYYTEKIDGNFAGASKRAFEQFQFDEYAERYF